MQYVILAAVFMAGYLTPGISMLPALFLYVTLGALVYMFMNDPEIESFDEGTVAAEEYFD